VTITGPTKNKNTTDPEIMRRGTVNLIAAGACLVSGIGFTVTGRPVTAIATLAILGLVNLAITLARVTLCRQPNKTQPVPSWFDYVRPGRPARGRRFPLTAEDLKSTVGNHMRVHVPPSAPKNLKSIDSALRGRESIAIRRIWLTGPIFV